MNSTSRGHGSCERDILANAQIDVVPDYLWHQTCTFREMFVLAPANTFFRRNSWRTAPIRNLSTLWYLHEVRATGRRVHINDGSRLHHIRPFPLYYEVNGAVVSYTKPLLFVEGSTRGETRKHSHAGTCRSTSLEKSYHGNLFAVRTCSVNTVPRELEQRILGYRD